MLLLPGKLKNVFDHATQIAYGHRKFPAAKVKYVPAMVMLPVVLPTIVVPINQGVIKMDMKKQPGEILDEWEYEGGERLEGLDQIRKYLDPGLSMRTFLRRHRKALEPYLLQRVDHWRKTKPGSKPKPKYFTYKRLILLYMIRKRLI